MSRLGKRTPWEALFGCSVGSRGSTRHEGRRAGRRTLKEAESSREDETSSEDGVDGGRRETAWARVKIRGRGGSGEPNAPAIRRHTRLRGAPNFRRGSSKAGSTRVAQRQARLKPPKGKSGRTASGSLGTLKTARPPQGGKHVTQQLARRKAGSTLQSLLRSRRRVPGKVHPPDRDRNPRQPRQSSG